MERVASYVIYSRVRNGRHNLYFWTELCLGCATHLLCDVMQAASLCTDFDGKTCFDFCQIWQLLNERLHWLKSKMFRKERTEWRGQPSAELRTKSKQTSKCILKKFGKISKIKKLEKVFFYKMAQAQPHPQQNRPNPLGPFNPDRKHSEPER